MSLSLDFTPCSQESTCVKGHVFLPIVLKPPIFLWTCSDNCHLKIWWKSHTFEEPTAQKSNEFCLPKAWFLEGTPTKYGKSWAVILCSPLLCKAQFYMKLSHPCQLSSFHSCLYITLIFGPALPSILSHPVPMPPSSSYVSCLIVSLSCLLVLTPSAQCIKTESGKAAATGFRQPNQSVNSCLVQKLSYLWSPWYVFPLVFLRWDNQNGTLLTEWSCFLFWFSP